MGNRVKASAEIFYVYSLGPASVNKKTNTNIVDIEVRNVDLKIRKSAHNYFYKPGEVLKYSLIISNIGNWVAEEVFVVDDLKSLVYLEDSCRILKDGVVIDDIKPHINDDHITFDIGNIDPNTTVIINYSAFTAEDIERNKTLSNHASLYAKRLNRIDSNLVNIEQKYALITTTKNASKQYVYNHDLLELYIYLKNTGNTTATDIKIIEELPAGFVPEEENFICLNDHAYELYEYDKEQHSVTITLDELGPNNEEVKLTIKGYIKLR